MVRTLPRPDAGPERSVSVALYASQRRVMRATAPTIAFVTPVGEGKSWTGAFWLTLRALERPKSTYLAAANSAKQVRRVLVKKLSECCDMLGVTYTHRIVDEEFLIHAPNGQAVIHLASLVSENVFERIRGTEYGAAWIDEARDVARYAYDVILGRMRCPHTPAHLLQILLTTTPAGHNWIWRLFKKDGDATDDDGRRLRDLIHVKKRENWRLPPNYDANMRGTYSRQLAAQELRAEFINIGQGRVYEPFDRDTHAAERLFYRSDLPLMVCLDFNVAPGSATIAQEQPYEGPRSDVADDIVAWIGEVNRTVDSRTRHVCTEILRRWGHHQGPVLVFGDPAGGQRQSNADDTNWRIVRRYLRGDTMSDEGDTPKLPPFTGPVHFLVDRRDPGVVARTEAFNRMLRDDDGVIRTLMDAENVPELVDDCDVVSWKEGADFVMDKSDQDRTHWADGSCYMFARRYPVGVSTPEFEEYAA